MSAAAANAVRQTSPKPAFTNQQLIPIYTDWANRYLIKAKQQPIHDLTYDLRDPKRLVQLIQAVTAGCPGTSDSVLLCALNVEDPIKSIEKALQYVCSLGVKAASSAKDLFHGHLGEILGFLFALSHYKQQQKALSSPKPTPALADAAAVSPLKASLIRKPTPAVPMSTATVAKTQRPSANTAAPADAPNGRPIGGSKLVPPSSASRKLAPPSTPAVSTSTVRSTRLPSVGATRLKPPVASGTSKPLQRATPQQTNERQASGILPPSGNVTPARSLVTSCSSTASSSASASSVLATASGPVIGSGLKPPQGGIARGIKPPTALKHRSSSAPRPAVAVATPPAKPPAATPVIAPSQSKMLKFFGKTRRSSASPVVPKDERATPATVPDPKPPSGVPKPSGRPPAALRAPSSGPLSVAVGEKAPDCSSTKLPKRPPAAASSLLRPPSSTRGVDQQPKRTSKSSSDDSAFGDDHSGSPSSPAALSPRLSQSPPPAKKTAVESVIAATDDSGISSDATSEPARHSQERKPTLAVRGITCRIAEEVGEVVEQKPAGEDGAEGDGAQVAVGGVNPIVPEAKTPAPTSKPAVPIRKTSRLQTVAPPKEDADVPPSPPSLRIPGMSRSGRALARPPADPKDRAQKSPADFDDSRPSAEMRPLEEASAMRSPMRRTNRMNAHRRDFNDSCDDTSSISTDVSQDFDDVSTDDLTGSSISADHPPMAATADFRKAERPRTAGGHHEPPRLHQRRLVEDVEQLLQRSRTSQRGVAYANAPLPSSRIYHTLQGPSVSARLPAAHPPQVRLSNDGETLSVARPSTARPSFRQPPPYSDHLTAQYAQDANAQSSAFHSHSLDRHGHLKQLAASSGELAYESTTGGHRFSVAPPPAAHQLAAVDGHEVYAAVSEIGRGSSSRPYRGYIESMAATHSPHGRPNAARGAQLRSASLSSANGGSLMSRSMVLYESDSNLSSPSESNNNQQSPANCTPRQRLYAEMMAAIRSRTPPRSRRLAPLSAADSPRLGSPSTRRSNGSLSARLPPTHNGSEYANAVNLHLHKLSNELNCSPRSPAAHLMRVANQAAYGNGSQLSLTSSLGSTYSMPEEAYDGMIRRLHDEVATCRQQISNMNDKKDDIHEILPLFDNKLELLARQMEKLRKKSAKPADIESLVAQIEDLRQLSLAAGMRAVREANGIRSQSIDPGDLRKHPSVESVSSYASMKAAKAADKGGHFARNGTKKGWTSNVDNQIRSSFTRAFTKGKKSKSGASSESEQSPLHRSALKPISDSSTALDEAEDGYLRVKLQETERQLSDVQLESLNIKREAELLRDTVNRLKNENKALKHTTFILGQKAMRNESRCDSRQSLSTCYHEDECLYETPPSLADRSCSSSSSSKRSSGGLNARVVVSLDIAGDLNFAVKEQELNIGFMPLPSVHTTWGDIDHQLSALMEGYIRRVDPEMTLGLASFDSPVGYQLADGTVRDCLNGGTPEQPPVDLIAPASVIKLRLRGVAQQSMDSLVLESLFPAEVLQKLLRLLLDSRRLVINGPTGSGKSKLLRYLARYLATQRGIPNDRVHDIAFPSNEADKQFNQVQQELCRVLKLEEEAIVVIDNMPRKRLDVICSALAAADEHFSADVAGRQVHGPFFLITLNRTESANLHLQQMQVAHNVHSFSLYCQIEPIKGFLGRYLRRRIAQDDYTGKSRASEQLEAVIEFLALTLQAINDFIKNVNPLDTIGPRIFFSCPLSSVEKSREWFIQLYNANILPFLAKVFRESDSNADWRDPKDVLADAWPWLDGIGAEAVLHSVSSELNKPSPQSTSSNSSVTSAMLSV